MRLPGKKVLMVVAPTGFRDEELFVPQKILEGAGAQVTVASTRTGQARGSNGGRATATTLIDRTRVSDYDAVLLVGGEGAPEHLWSHLGLRALVQEAAQAGTLLGAICLAPVVLARAGLLAGQEAAVWRSPEALEEFTRAGVRVADQDLVCGGQMVTARGPLFADRWGREIAALLVADRKHGRPSVGSRVNRTNQRRES